MESIETYEDKRTFEGGIMGEITRHSIVDAEYPNIVISVTPEKPVVAHQLEALKRVFAHGQNATVDTQFVTLYITDGVKTVRLGQVETTQMRLTLRLLEKNEVYGYYDKDTKLEGDMLYVLVD